MATLFQPAIVVVAYNRPDSLRRLLEGIAAGNYPEDLAVPLIISIDKSDSRDVAQVAEAFHWPYGDYRIIEHPRRLGLRDHIISCGDLAYEYGCVIILEDDLMVSPAFYRYTQDALTFYEEDKRIAGVSLYTHALVPYLYLPFIPLPDEGDVFFLQFASSWGQAWSASQWRSFRDWYDIGQVVNATDPLPTAVSKWPDSSWLKYFIKYMVENNLYFVYPRYSLTTNCGDPGIHMVNRQTVFQVPIVPSGRTFHFQGLKKALAVYDAHFELLADRLNRLTDRFSGLSYEVDTYGSKDTTKLSVDYLLTSRPCRKAKARFGNDMLPAVMNAVHGTQGNMLSLCRHDYALKPLRENLKTFYEFNARYSLRLAVWFTCLKILAKLRSIFLMKGKRQT